MIGRNRGVDRAVAGRRRWSLVRRLEAQGAAGRSSRAGRGARGRPAARGRGRDRSSASSSNGSARTWPTASSTTRRATTTRPRSTRTNARSSTAPRLGTTEELSTIIDTLATGRYSLACVRARVAGEPVPELRVPCFFNPQHGPSARDVMYTVPRRGTQRLPACTCARPGQARRSPRSGPSRSAPGTWPTGRPARRTMPYSQGYFPARGSAAAALTWGSRLLLRRQAPRAGRATTRSVASATTASAATVSSDGDFGRGRRRRQVSGECRDTVAADIDVRTAGTGR